MAAVCFAIGNHPAITAHEAIDIADLLLARRTLASLGLANRIRARAERDPDKGETSDDIDLDVNEIITLLSLLSEESASPGSRAVILLRSELIRALDADR